MAVMTVLGPIERDSLGITLPHEHLFLDLTCQFSEPADPDRRRLAHDPLGPAHAALLARNPYAVRDNLILDDVDLAVQELACFRNLGGRTVVDCTSIGAGRNAQRLGEVAERSGLNILAGAGYYLAATHPPDFAHRSVEEIAAEIVRDLTEGIDGTDIHAGVIGEIGTGDPIHPQEIKSLQAAALAHQQTGAPLQIHTYPWGRSALQIVDLLEQCGVNPARVVICHIDVSLDLDYLRRLLQRGVYVEFDDFGKEFPVEAGEANFAAGPFASDRERVEAVVALVEAGFERQILISNDICFKQMLHRYGGRGYDHLLRNVVPALREAGLSPETIGRFLIDNPAAWLDPQG